MVVMIVMVVVMIVIIYWFVDKINFFNNKSKRKERFRDLSILYIKLNIEKKKFLPFENGIKIILETNRESGYEKIFGKEETKAKKRQKKILLLP